jgi:hypothetical protein
MPPPFLQPSCALRSRFEAVLKGSEKVKLLTPEVEAKEDKAHRRLFVLQIVQPGLTGLMDGSVSTLAPVFAAAFATQTLSPLLWSASPLALEQEFQWARWGRF